MQACIVLVLHAAVSYSGERAGHQDMKQQHRRHGHCLQGKDL